MAAFLAVERDALKSKSTDPLPLVYQSLPKHGAVHQSLKVENTFTSLGIIQRYLLQTSAQHSCPLPRTSPPEATRPIITNIQINIFQILPVE